MKHVSLLIPRGPVVMETIIGTYGLFKVANQYLESKGRSPFFNLKLVTLKDYANSPAHPFMLKTDHTLDEIQKTDLVIIAALEGDFQQQIETNKEIIQWVTDQYKNGAEIASLCNAAFVLASTGLINGRKCTTHWAFANQFEQMFPKVDLRIGEIITDEFGIYTSAGAYSFLNLILYLIDKNCGREVSIYCAKYCQVQVERETQSPFMIFNGQKNHGDEMVLKIQAYLEKNYIEKITIPELATKHSISQRNFERRFKAATGNTPMEYLLRIRIEAARRRFESSLQNCKEVAYSVGFSDDKAFRNIFKKLTSMTPLTYQKRYNHLYQLDRSATKRSDRKKMTSA